MKPLSGIEKPQPECSCQLCSTLRAHDAASLEFELADTLPAKTEPRVMTLEELKDELRKVWGVA